MNQDPNNPVAPQAPGFANPAAAAAPDLGATPAAPATSEAPTTPAPEAPATPEAAPAPAPEAPAAEAPVTPDVPTIDPSLLQQAIADVPEEAAATTPDAPSAVPLDNAAPATPEATAVDTSLFAGAAPAADLSATPANVAAMAPNPTPGEAEQKSTPSVAFNDPASQPDAAKPHEIKMPAFVEKLKKNPVVLIIGGSAIIIIALVLIIAFAV